jgi:diaminopimelate decarboxylase
MNDLLRPALYGAIHSVESVSDGRVGRDRVTADVVGPICESSDFFLRDAVIDLPHEGDLLAIRDVGAYGFAMSSNYNFRGRPPEVWVEGGSFRLVRRRETFDDIVRAERE